MPLPALGAAKAIWDLIGVKGVIIIALAVVCAFQYLQIGSLENTVGEQKVTIDRQTVVIERLEGNVGRLEAGLKIQNDAVAEEARKREELQKQLTSKDAKNQELAAALSITLNTLNKLPPPKSCPDTMQELRTRWKEWGIEWNKQ
jgi:uncharacterized coiled-coil protein SlyX